MKCRKNKEDVTDVSSVAGDVEAQRMQMNKTRRHIFMENNEELDT